MTIVNERAAEILNDCGNLLKKKGEDYSGGSVDEKDYFKFSHEAPNFDMIWTKVLRYKSMIDQGDNGNFESITDTLQDLACYAARAHAYIDLYWNEEENKDE